MARIAEVLESVVLRGKAQIVRGDIVDECKSTARYKDTGSLSDKVSRLGEVMCGEPAGDEVIARIGKR